MRISDACFDLKPYIWVMDTVPVSFHEVQRFRQWWIWPLIIVLASVPFVLTWLLVFSEEAPKPTRVFPVIFAFVFSILPVALLYSIRLETTITTEHISYRFFPLHKKKRVLQWGDIASVYVRKYSPMFEYGGYGARVSLRNGVCLNISGKSGIQLVLKNGKRILIGTLCPDEAEALLRAIGKN